MKFCIKAKRILPRKLETSFYGDRANQLIPSVPDEIEKKVFTKKYACKLRRILAGDFIFRPFSPLGREPER